MTCKGNGDLRPFDPFTASYHSEISLFWVHIQTDSFSLRLLAGHTYYSLILTHQLRNCHSGMDGRSASGSAGSCSHPDAELHRAGCRAFAIIFNLVASMNPSDEKRITPWSNPWCEHSPGYVRHRGVPALPEKWTSTPQDVTAEDAHSATA